MNKDKKLVLAKTLKDGDITTTVANRLVGKRGKKIVMQLELEGYLVRTDYGSFKIPESKKISEDILQEKSMQ